jgi:hypothetical protein
MKNIQNLDNKFFLLTNEAAIAAMNLSTGIKFLSKADFVKKAYFLNSYFSLSIGFERLLKLIIVYEYYLSNNKLPENNYLKNFGHNLTKLFDKSKLIADQLNVSKFYADVFDDEICKEIIYFLSEFAVKTRYYNLDNLNSEDISKEPLTVWNNKINSIINQRHYKNNDERVKKIKELTKKLDDLLFVSVFDSQDKHITTIENFYTKGLSINTERKYSVFYTYKIIRFLSNLIHHIDAGKLLPFVSEYFVIFRNSNDKYVLSRKTWDLYER